MKTQHYKKSYSTMTDIYIVSVNSKKRVTSPLKWQVRLTNPGIFR